MESKPQHWRPGHNVLVKEIEDVNKMKMGLYVTHIINFQNYGDKNSQRSELVLELKKFFEEFGIKYHLLPQEVHLRYVGSTPPTFQPFRWWSLFFVQTYSCTASMCLSTLILLSQKFQNLWYQRKRFSGNLWSNRQLLKILQSSVLEINKFYNGCGR